MSYNQLTLCLAILPLLVGQIPARVIIDPGVDEAGNGLYGGMVQGRQITALLTITTTVSRALTTTLSTGVLCVKLSTSGTLTPSAACGRRRRNWNERRGEEPMLYVLYGDDGEDIEFVKADQIQPSKVNSVEATEVALFRDNIVSANQDSIQSSIDKSDSGNTVRIAQPIYFAALASLLSNAFPNAVQSTTTQTKTSTVYAGGTTVVTVFTATTSYTLIGSCYPVFPPVCSA